MLRKLILSVRYRKEKETFTKKIAIIVHNMETRKMILKSLGNLYHQSLVNRSREEYEIFCTPLEYESNNMVKLRHWKTSLQLTQKQGMEIGDMLTVLIGNARHYTAPVRLSQKVAK